MRTLSKPRRAALLARMAGTLVFALGIGSLAYDALRKKASLAWIMGDAAPRAAVLATYAQTWGRLGLELDHAINDAVSLSGSVHLATNGRDPTVAISAGTL